MSIKKALLLGLMIWPLIAGAGDFKREADYADSILKTLAIGKAVWLEADGKKFLGLYTETVNADSKTAALIVHDQGGHPNQRQQIYGLRVYLPEHSWTSLAIQMPLREAGAGQKEYFALFPEAEARIRAGVKYLTENGAEKVAVVGYGLGALMAAHTLSKQAEEVQAFAAISLPVPRTDKEAADTISFIEKIKIPMLDIYAARDLPDVVNTDRERRLAAKENRNYRQVRLDDEGHAYLHDEGLLVKRVYSWLGATLDKP